MVCLVYTVPTSEAYISAKFGASPGKPRMFLCSFNVAGVVFKKKTDGGREGLVLLWTFLYWNVTDTKTLQNRTSPIYTPLQHSHIFSCPAYIYFKENAHDFCFHLAYVATAKLTY